MNMQVEAVCIGRTGNPFSTLSQENMVCWFSHEVDITFKLAS